MTLTTYTPLDLQIDRLFNEAVRTMGGQVTGRAPHSNVWEDADHFYIESALPGWQAKDLDIKVEDGVLTLKGAWSQTAPEGRTYHMREGEWGTFSRSFVLPTNVDAGKATASFKDGILAIQFPKREDAKPRQISIQ